MLRIDCRGPRVTARRSFIHDSLAIFQLIVVCVCVCVRAEREMERARFWFYNEDACIGFVDGCKLGV